MNTRRGKIKKKVFKLISYCVLILLGFVFIYPLLFMISASFKGNQELMTSMSLIPKHVSFENYVNGWKGVGQYSFGHFLKNSGVLVIPVVLLTVMSSSIVAYGFARFRFKGHDLLFILMISTLMLPSRYYYSKIYYVSAIEMVKYLYSFLCTCFICMLSFFYFFHDTVYSGNSKRY